MKNFFFVFMLLAFRAQAEDSFFIGEPLALKNEAYSTVLNRYPNAELWIIQNYARQNWDKGCSQFGWMYLFIGSDSGIEKDIRIKFDHTKQNDGTCKYIARRDLEVAPNQVVGIQRLKLDKVQIPLEEALSITQKAINLPYKIWWAKLVTPLHPSTGGRVFWNFKGPVECNKGVEVTIDSSTGQIEKQFSAIPTCP